jgi:hypothetical protein
MISRTGDLVHLNALTFFEIFGFMQNKNGLAATKPRQIVSGSAFIAIPHPGQGLEEAKHE